MDALQRRVFMLIDNLSNEEKGIMAMTVLAFLVAFWAGSTLLAGVFTGMLSSIGAFLLFAKLKSISPAMWRFLIERSLLLDVLLSGLSVWMVASTSVTGIIAAASSALFSSLAVTVVSRKFKKNCLDLVIK